MVKSQKFNIQRSKPETKEYPWYGSLNKKYINSKKQTNKNKIMVLKPRKWLPLISCSE